MKVIRNSSIIILIFFAIQVYGQDNSVIKIEVGGMAISIPLPANGFVKIKDEKQIIAQGQVPPQNKLLALFLSKEPANLTKKMTIQVPKDLEFIDCSPSAFDELKLNLKSTFSIGLSKVINDVNAQLPNIEDIIGKVKVGEMKTIGNIFENTNAVNIMAITSYNTDQGVKKVLGGVGCIRIKNRAIFIYVSSLFENEESFKWVYSTTIGWTKSILSTNLDKN